MPLKMVTWPGLLCPKVFCDWCNDEITDGRDGNYNFIMARDGKMAEREPIYYTHKHCCRPFETAHGRGEGVMWGAMELAYLPIYLGDNLHVDWEEARDGAAAVAQPIA